MHRSEDSQSQAKLKKRLGELKTRASARQYPDSFRPYTNKWLFAAIREMLFLRSTSSWTSNSIQKRLIFKANKSDIQAALNQILENEDQSIGEFHSSPRARNADLGSADSKFNLERRISQAQSLDLAKQALDQIPIEQRKFRKLTMAVKADQMNSIKNEIEEFFVHLDQKYSSRAGDEVVSLQMAMFPLTKKNNDDGGHNK